jgi:hypothetical protein
MPRVKYESTIPVLEWVKSFRALDRSATAIGTDMPLFNVQQRII